MEQAQNLVLFWATYGNSTEKIGFLKAFLQCCSVKELHHIKGIVTKTASKVTNKQIPWVGPLTEKEAAVAVSTLVKGKQPPAPTVTPATAVESQINQPSERKHYFKKFSKRDIVALDVEKVQMIGVQEVDANQAATVSIVNMLDEVLLDEVVQRKPGSFIVNKHTLKINKIKKYDLANGKPIDQIKSEISLKLHNKLVVVVAGENDFRSLGEMIMSEFETLELQKVYVRSKLKANLDACFCKSEEECNCHAVEPMSLRDMFFYHFREDIQKGAHTSLADAFSTIRVFREGYVPLKLRPNEHPLAHGLKQVGMFDNAINLKRKEKLGEYFCKTQNDFVKGCICDTCK